jgi:hypothetical protein
LKQAYLWALLLIIWNLLPCKMCQLCPVIEDMVVPDDCMDGSGTPKYIELVYKMSKGTTVVRMRFRIHRNYVNINYCPVTALLTWLATSNVQSGPIFPRLWESSGKEGPMFVHHKRYDTKSHLTKYYADVDEKQVVNLSDSILKRYLVVAILNCGYAIGDVQLYYIRKSATKWAARCGAEQFHIIAAGRWKQNSRHFQASTRRRTGR